MPPPRSAYLHIQPLTQDQLHEVVALDQRCLGGLWSLDGYQRELDSPNSDLLVLQAKSVDNPPPNLEAFLSKTPVSVARLPASLPCILGFACQRAIADEAHITILAIHPEIQRQGLGQALLWTLLKTAHDRGLKWATLEVGESNHAARSLYAKFGFREAGRRPNYYPNTGEDALILWRNGLQAPDFPATLATWQHQMCDRLSQSS